MGKGGHLCWAEDGEEPRDPGNAGRTKVRHVHKQKLVQVEGALEGAFFAVDFLLELEDGVEQSFGARWAAGDVNVDGEDLVAALDDGVIVEDAAAGGASAHGDDPLGLGHLVVKLADDGGHFLREAAGDDHEVGLAWGRAENFGAEAGNVKAGSGHGHHLDGAAGEAEAEGPDGAAAGPVYGFIEGGEDDAFVFEEGAEVVGLG
jgi:hypothetical protein